MEFGAGWFGEVWGRVAGGGGGRQEFGVETSGVGGRGRGKFAAVGAVAGGVGGCGGERWVVASEKRIRLAGTLAIVCVLRIGLEKAIFSCVRGNVTLSFNSIHFYLFRFMFLLK